MEPGEATWVVSEAALVHAELHCGEAKRIQQMVYPAERSVPEADAGVAPVLLSCKDSEEMLALTAIAFPHFFRRRTCVMGR